MTELNHKHLQKKKHHQRLCADSAETFFHKRFQKPGWKEQKANVRLLFWVRKRQSNLTVGKHPTTSARLWRGGGSLCREGPLEISHSLKTTEQRFGGIFNCKRVEKETSWLQQIHRNPTAQRKAVPILLPRVVLKYDNDKRKERKTEV